MCLSTVSLNLFDYDKGSRDFIGYGYKKLRSNKLSSYKNSWQKATGNMHDIDSVLEDASIYANDGKKYRPGFHIFLDKKNDVEYGSSGSVVKVAFRGVIGLGINTAGDGQGPCVISKYMKVLPKDKQD
jgi:hypothetical protein